MRRQAFLAFVAFLLLALALGEPDIRAQTTEPKTLDDPEAYAVYAALLPGEWAIRNARARGQFLREGFSLGISYVVLPSAELTSFFADRDLDGWNRFYKRFPDSGGFIVMSAVGFDAERRRAMVQLWSRHGYLGAKRMFYFLTRTDGGWKEIQLPRVSACIVMS